MAEIDLNDADHAIIEVLREGRNTPANIARKQDYTREYVANRLKRLTEHGHVERPDRGIYELVEDPSTDEEQDTNHPASPDLDALEFDRDLTEGRREVIREFLEWVQQEGPITKSDFEEFYTDDHAERAGYNAGSFWEIFGKAALKQLDEVEQPNAWKYQWIGN